MLARPVGPAVFSLLLVFPALAGCLGGESGNPPSTASAQDAAPSMSASATPAANASTPPEPPVANLSASGPNLTQTPDGYAGFVGDYTFSGINSTGNISRFEWTFGDNATGDGATIEHAYPAAGTYNITLTVTDEAGLNDSAAVSLVVVEKGSPAPKPFLIEDPSGDSRTEYGDLLRINMTDDGIYLYVGVKVRTVTPQYRTAALVIPSLWLNGNEYVPFYCLTLVSGIWGYKENKIIPGARVSVDETNRIWLLTLPLKEISAKLPFQVYVQSTFSDSCADRTGVYDDRAPNAGTASYPPT